MASVEALIVSYNTRDLLRDCLRSLFAHLPADGTELRAAVLDNASADGSAAMVEQEFPQVRLVRSDENLGFGAGNNRLAETSTADYLLLLNSDTILTEEITSPLLAELERDPAIAIASPRLEFPDGQVQYSSTDFPTLRFEAARTVLGTPLERLGVDRLLARTEQRALADDRATRDTEFAWATCWLIRRCDPDLQPIFDAAFPMYDEDLDTCRRLAARGRRVVYVPGVTVIHLGGASAPSRTRFALARGARQRYFRRYHGRLPAAIFAAMKWPAESKLGQRLLGR